MEPEFAARVRRAKREERFAGGTVRNFFRTPFGPGWALVGDAGSNEDRRWRPADSEVQAARDLDPLAGHPAVP
jgi:hypothetical protein